MNRRNYWKVVAIIEILIIIGLLISKLQLSKETTIIITKSIFSKEFLSSFFGAAVAAIISLFVFYKQSRQAEKIMNVQIETQEKQLNQQLQLSNEQFNEQQYLDIKKIELNYNIENLENIKSLLNELLNITENKIKPLTELIINQHEYCFNPVLYDNPPLQENWDRDYQKYTDLMTRVHAINNELSTYSQIFDSKFQNSLTNFLNGDFGLFFYEKHMTEVWGNIVKYKSDQREFNFRDENFEYIVPTLHILENIFVLTQTTIPVEINRNIKELKDLFVTEKKDTN
ncbi:MAG: hypothetical protein WAV43_06290 [Streptococcus parauberis]